MEKHLRKSFFIAVLIFSITAISNAQYDVPGDYATVVAAINAIKANKDVAEAVINVAEGEYMEPAQYAGQAGREMKITIQGAGADKTFLIGNDVPYKPGDGGHRFLRLDREKDNGSVFIVKDLTLKNFGYGDYNGGGIVNITHENATASASFINVNFESICARRGGIAQIFWENKTVVFDNCSFFNCLSWDNDDITGLFHMDGGNLTISNSLFMSNKISPLNMQKDWKDENRKNGGIISLITTTKGNSIVTLENVVFVDNKTISDSLDFIHPLISAKPGNDPDLNIELGLIGVLAIGNQAEGHTNAVDLYFADDERVKIEADGTIMNKVMKFVKEGDEISNNPADVEGIIAYAGFHYTHPGVDFVMDGDLPEVFLDDYGVKHVDWNGDGSYDETGTGFLHDNLINIYSFNNNLIVKGIQIGEIINVYTITGSLFATHKTTDNEITMPLPKGLYIVKVGTVARKVLIP